MVKRSIKLIFLVCLLFNFSNLLAVQEENLEENAQDITQDVADSLEMDNFLAIFEEYATENDIEEFNVNTLYDELISGQGIQYDNILDILVNSIFKEIKNTISSVTSIFIIVIIMAIVTSLELDKDSDVLKITKLVIFIAISALLLKNYLDIVTMFKNIVNMLGYIMQVVSTFLLGILMATGKITSTGVVEPLLLFIANFICFATEYIIIPFFTISIAINIVSRISENIKMDNLSNMFRKSSLYIFTTIIGVFLFVLSMESSVTKSIDTIYFKTAQNMISNVVPVVGKFLSDSLDTVLGATQLIGKVGGIVSLVTTIIIVSIPIIKIICVIVLYNILIAISEPINEDKSIESFLKGFVGVYKDMLGILIGIMVLFIMSTGIILSIISSMSG